MTVVSRFVLSNQASRIRTPNVESFNGRVRDECLNEHWFTSLPHAQAVIEAWRREYNEERPKKGLGVDACPVRAAPHSETEYIDCRTLEQSATQDGGTSRRFADAMPLSEPSILEMETSGSFQASTDSVTRV